MASLASLPSERELNYSKGLGSAGVQTCPLAARGEGLQAGVGLADGTAPWAVGLPSVWQVRGSGARRRWLLLPSPAPSCQISSSIAAARS